MARLIVGHVTHQSARIWMRGYPDYSVAFAEIRAAGGRQVASAVLELEEVGFFTGVWDCEGLTAASSYTCHVAFGESTRTPEQERVRAAYTKGYFRTAPPPGSSEPLTFVLGSCNLHTLGGFKRPGPVFTRVSALARQMKASFMIHCGDQIYADVPLPPVSGVYHYRRKYLDAWRDTQSARKLLTELPHYMILDDHEIINNYSADHPDGQLSEAALQAYFEFQHSHNPPSPEGSDGYYFKFQYGDIQFFVFDVRAERHPVAEEMISTAQMKEFKDWLALHADVMKFVVTPVPFVAQAKPDNDRDKWCGEAFSSQREEIMKHILENGIEHVVFLTGDMHVSYHATLRLRRGPKSAKVHELMSSPLNHRTPERSLESKFVPQPFNAIRPDGLEFTSEISPSTYFSKHSNVMLIQVDGFKVTWKLYRTRKRAARIIKRTFTA